MQYKKLFGQEIRLCDATCADVYPRDISPMFQWMQNFELPKNPIIFDIGANIGLYSLSFATIFKGAEIHCFEPVPFIFECLRQNVEINPKLSDNLHIHNVGMSNCQKQMSLSIPTPEQHPRYSNSTDIRHFSVLGQGEEKYEAKFTSLDKWINNYPIRCIDLIKIDVEGYEYPVLQGASNTLHSFRPIVIFELNQLTLALSSRTAEDYLMFARDHNYKIFGLEYGYKIELLEIQSAEQVVLISDLILFPY